MHHIITFIGECPEAAHCNYVHKTLGLLSDAPHITSEVVVSLVELGIGFLFGRRYAWTKLHRKFDKEHNIEH